ncbi:hypothetical protein Tco_0445861 [Tanacetum coccineum]
MGTSLAVPFVAPAGPTIPTTSSSPKVVERETEVTKNTVPPTNNGIIEDVQPPFFQDETSIDEITLTQTLIEIKAAKPKSVTTAATTTTTRPKARGVVVQEPSEFRTTTSSPQASQPSKTKDKGKAIMIEPKVPLKKKDQVALDKEMARNLEAQFGKKDESSSKKAKIAQDSSAKKAGDKLESDKSNKQKTDENEEVEVDNEVELKKHMVTVKDDDIAINVIPFATKPPVIVEYKLIREGIMRHY